MLGLYKAINKIQNWHKTQFFSVLVGITFLRETVVLLREAMSTTVRKLFYVSFESFQRQRESYKVWTESLDLRQYANKVSNPKYSSPKIAHHSNLALFEDKVPTVTWSRTVKAIVLGFLPLSLQLFQICFKFECAISGPLYFGL